jgi:hypothetical protein
MTNSNIQELSLQELESLQGGWDWPLSFDCTVSLIGFTATVVGVFATGPAGASVVAAVSGSVGGVTSIIGTLRSCG